MLKYTVKCEKQEILIGLIPFQSIYALLLGMNNCSKLSTFCYNPLPQGLF